MAISDKLTYLNTTKTKIREGLNSLGADLDTEDTFRSYADAIEGIYEDYPKITGEGESLSLDNTKQASMQIDYKGNTSQVSYTGKNKFGFGVSAIDKTTTYRPTATQRLIATGINSNEVKFEYNGNYCRGYFEIDGIDGTQQWNISYDIKENTTSYNPVVYIDTTNSTNEKLVFYFSGNNGSSAVYDQYFILTNIQVESGNERTTFEPYVGGIHSPNPSYPQPINVVSGDNTIDICGKNLFDISQTPVVINTHYDSSGTIQVWSNYVGIREYVEVSSNTTYVQSNNLGLDIARVCFYDNTKTFLSAVTTNSFTTPNNAKYIRFSIYSEGTVLPTWLQIEKGSTATTYEPYIRHSYPIYLGVENLFDKNNMTKITGTIDNATRFSGGGSNYAIVILCLPNTTYCVQKRNDGDTNRFAVASSETIPSSGEGTQTTLLNGIRNDSASSMVITTGATAKYLIVNYYRSAEATLTEQQIIDSIIINKGNMPSHVSSQPIELCKIGNYVDFIFPAINGNSYYDSLTQAQKDLLTYGSWYLHKEIGKVVYTGTSDENWNGNSPATGIYRFYRVISDLMPYTDTSRHIDRFKTNYFYGSTNTVIGGQFQYTTQLFFQMDSTICADVSSWKTWLNTHNLIVYYVLATPTNTLIEDTTLIEQLEESKLSYVSQTNISQVNNDLPFIISASALRGE